MDKKGKLSMNFSKNDNNFRPLKMLHGHFGYRLWQPYFWAMFKAKRSINKFVVKAGYGGAVLNTYNGKKFKNRYKHYLTDEKTFKYLRGVLKICKEKGVRVWIYDELGYPSGAAFGKVVEKYPETECYGIICNPHPLKKGESISLDLPHGHEKLKAVLFDDGVLSRDITDLADQNLITYTAESDGTLYYIASKALYEGVHPTRKFSPHCRYIDVMDKNAVSKFLEMTFENYVKYLGEFFGNTIEAVFTDEPSVMNQYFSELPYNAYQINPTDDSIPLYKFVAWSRNFEAEFKTRKGYDITPDISKLFESNGDSPSKVKQDYYEVCRALYKEAYFDQYAEFCEKHGLKLSGHLLGEERLEEQIINELDFFDVLKPMHYPGIDLLTCQPQNVVNQPLLLKTVSSAAALEGKAVVMSETGIHWDNKAAVTKEKTLCSLLIQYANGINTITSYMNKGTNAKSKRYCYERLAKAGQLLKDGKFYSELLVYYPVKSGYTFNTPSEMGHNERDYDTTFEKICKGFKTDLLDLEKYKISYTIFNSSYMSEATLQNNEICVGKCLPFKAVYIPYCFIEAEGIEQDILRLAKLGAKIFVNEGAVLTPALKELQNLRFVKSTQQISDMLYTDFSQNIIFEKGAENIVYCNKISNDKSTFMFVNSSVELVELVVKIHETKAPVGYDVISETKFTPNTEKIGDYQKILLSIPPYEARFLIF